LAQNQAAMANNQNFFNGIQNIGGQNQASLNNAYGPSGFGGDTARYAALGAAYGRGTGGFNGGQQVAPAYGQTMADFQGRGASPASVNVDSSPFDTGNTGAVPYLSGGGLPFGGGGFGRMPTAFDTGTQGVPNLSGGGMPFGGGGFGRPSYTPNFDQAFNSNFSPANPTIGFGQRAMPSLGYDPSSSATLPPGPPPSKFDPQSAIDAVNQFAGRGVEPTPMGGSGLGRLSGARLAPNFDPTAGSVPQNFPSSLGAFELGTSAVPHARMPTAFDTGANPVPHQQMPTAFDTGTSPVPFFGGTSPAREGNRNVFESGAPSFFGSASPSLGFGVSAYPGGGIGSRDATSNFAAPSSPFEGGASPVPFQSTSGQVGGQAFPVPGIGGYRGTMRDQVAAAMSGSGGMNEPQVNGGPQSPPSMVPPPNHPGPTPTPTQPQMADAWRRISAGPGTPGVSSVAQQVPPPPAPYARINQAIYDIGNVSRPDMFDNLSRPIGSMFSPGQYRGR
jgi:hypothetical protein